MANKSYRMLPILTGKHTNGVPSRISAVVRALTGPESNAGMGWANSRVLPGIDLDDYETLQTVAEICAMQDILDRPDG